MNWKILDSVEQLDQLIQSSDACSFAIFKHSTRCSISSIYKGRIERNWDLLPDNFPLYYLDLLTYRPISDAISCIFNVEHQSPQLILVKDRKCIFHTSHADIDLSEMVEKIR